MSNVPIHTQILYDRSQEFRGLEIQLDSNRKIAVENMGIFEPLSKYMDADRLLEIAGRDEIGEIFIAMKLPYPAVKLDAFVTVYDQTQQARPSTQRMNHSIRQNQNLIQQVYQDVKKDIRPQSKGFSTRSYSAFTKKRKV